QDDPELVEEPVDEALAGHGEQDVGDRHSSPSSPSAAPGQGLASRLIRTKSLRRGCPSNCSGSSSFTGWGWPSNTIPNSSAASRSCQLAPGHTSVRVGQRGSSGSHRTLSLAWRLCRVEWTWHTTS